MDNETHFIIYQITNLVNGKIYIGKHKTNNLDDGYMGSGKILKKSIRKYGIENFKKEILFDFDSFEEMDNKERELVNEDFVARADTYNLKVGGDGGFDYINKSNIVDYKARSMHGGLVLKQRLTKDKKLRKQYSTRAKILNKNHPENLINNRCNWTGRHHSNETKKKISEKAKLRVGEKNNAFGTIWIYNEFIKENKKIKKELVDIFLSKGWMIGRKMTYYKK